MAVLVVADLAVQLGIPRVLRVIIDGATGDGPARDLTMLAGIVVLADLAY